jgi:hypothetical protein
MNNPLDWLLEPGDIGIEYLTRRDLLHLSEKELLPFKQRAHNEGPIARVLEKMEPEGYWVKPGAGYGPKYHGTVWSMILLSQLGASIEMDQRLSRACSYMLDHTLAVGGQFSWNGTRSCTIDCLQGNLCIALLDIGCQDPRLDTAFEWMAGSQTGQGLAPMGDKSTPERYYQGKCGPNFACTATNRQPCAWGAVKVMLAFSKYPPRKCTPLMKKAIAMGTDFIFGIEPSEANYPTGSDNKPNSTWWKFGFPIFYGTDLLQLAEAMVGLGLGSDPRLSNTLKYIRSQQDEDGCWQLRHHYNGKTWIEVGRAGLPNKWVTLRALKVLASVSGQKALSS